MKNRPLFSGCLIGILLICLCVKAGGTRFVDEFRPSVLENNINEKSFIRLSGQVYDLDVKENCQIVYLKNNSIYNQNKSFKESRIIVYDEEKLNIGIGNELMVSGEISFYEKERNPGNFNQKLYYKKQDIHASVWAFEIQITDNAENKFRQRLFEFRIQWKNRIYDVLGEETGSVLAAMLLAEKSGMNEDTKELYQANGIGHILAISGLHLSIIGVGIYKIIRRLSGSFVAGGIVGISVLLLYVFMIGISVSVFRAVVMFLFRVGADMTGRHYDRVTALGTSAFLTVLWNPLYLLDGGFWLSYRAIIAIISILPIFEDLMFQGFWASISINIVTLPVLIYCFYEIPTYSVFLNMLIVPLMTLLLSFGMGGSLCDLLVETEGIFCLQRLGNTLMKICGLILKLYEKICEMSLELPVKRIVTGQKEMWQIYMYYIVLVIVVIIWKCRKRRTGLLYGIIIMNLLIFFLPVNEIIYRANGEISITMVDVSQGDALFVRGPDGNTYFIDGGSSDVSRVGKYKIEPYLKSQGVGKLDYVFVSHGDQDHINGIEEMIERGKIGVTIETIVFPDKRVWGEELIELANLASKKGIRIVEMKAGQIFKEGKMTISCLSPMEVTGEGNADSMVFALNYKEFDMLFTGDIEAEGERNLEKVLEATYQNVNWEVLKVAHHGSKNSTSETFLDCVKPMYSLISAGRENSYGHPHAEVLERLDNVKSIILSTQDNGAITIVTDGKKLKVQGYVKE